MNIFLFEITWETKSSNFLVAFILVDSIITLHYIYAFYISRRESIKISGGINIFNINASGLRSHTTKKGGGLTNLYVHLYLSRISRCDSIGFKIKKHSSNLLLLIHVYSSRSNSQVFCLLLFAAKMYVTIIIFES